MSKQTDVRRQLSEEVRAEERVAKRRDKALLRATQETPVDARGPDAVKKVPREPAGSRRYEH